MLRTRDFTASGAPQRAIGYTRVSGRSQAENFSTDAQTSEIRSYADKHGFELLDVVNEVFTGFTDRRPELDSLFAQADRGAFDVLIVAHPDRIGRDRYLMNVLWQFDSFGVDIHACNRGILNDENDDAAQLQNGFDSLISGQNRRDIRRRVNSGIREKVLNQGRVIAFGATALYGYRYEGFRKTRELVVDEQTAPIVRELFTRYDAGERITAICDDFERRGISRPGITANSRYKESPRPNHWISSSVYTLLRQSTYVGRYRNFQHASANAKKRISAEIVEVPCPAIVDTVLWERVQVRLSAGRTNSPRNTQRFYLLRNRITCVCGQGMIGETKQARSGEQGRQYYRCNATQGRRNHITPCYERSVHLTDVDGALWHWVETELLTENMLRAALKAASAQNAVQRRRIQATTEHARRELADLDSAEDQLLDAQLTKLFSQAKIEARMAKVQVDRADATRRLKEAEAELQSLGSDEATIEQVLADMRRWHGLEYTDAEKRELLDVLDVRVRLLPDRKHAEVSAKLPKTGGIVPIVSTII